MPYKLIPTFQAYPWGSKSYIQKHFNQPEKKGSPLAEMWLGAHPKAPSRILAEDMEIPLNLFIARHPQATLGKAIGVNDGQLPFLLKVLAADEPLSIQVHPDKATAMLGFAAEEAAGIALDDPRRTFKDANHKPEMLCALTEFTMMCGFRKFAEIIKYFGMFQIEHLWKSFAPFASNPSPQTLKSLFREVLDSSDLQLSEFNKRINRIYPKHNSGFLWIQYVCLQLWHSHKLDAGIVAPLLLNLVVLEPSDAVYFDAGILHAYVEGAGIELMANSDNVIRGGLTPKYIDKDKLFSLTSFEPSKPKIIHPKQIDALRCKYHCPTPEFELHAIELNGFVTLRNLQKPLILLCLKGKITCNEVLTIGQGDAAFVSAEEQKLFLKGRGKVLIASLPRAIKT